MADGSVKFDTAIDSSGIRNGLAGLGKIAMAGVAAASAAIVGLGVSAVKTGMEFDSAMSQVAATMGTTVDKIDALREKAKEMGAKTAFSATEAAQALNYLALAGYDADKQMEALPTVLNLAAAGTMDLAYASDLVTDSMSALGLETSELTVFADKMAKTASKANTSVAQLGEATLICGGQAKLAGMSVTDMNTALGILADNGIKGSEGGTALRNVLKNLYTPTEKQARALADLGVATANADGSLRDAQDVLKDLSGALDGLTEADKMQAMANIFDTRTIAGANALLNNATDRWDELSAAIDDSADACERMAATQLDNLEGDITILESAFSGLKISISDGLTGSLREFVQFGTQQLDILNAAMAEGGFSGLIEALGTVLGNVTNKLVSYAPVLVEAALGLIENLITTIVGSSGAIIDAVIDIGMQLVDSIVSMAPQLITAGAEIIAKLAVGIYEAFPTLITNIVGGLMACVDAIVKAIPMLVSAAKQCVQAIVKALPTLIPMYIGAVTDVITAVLELLPELVPMLLEAVTEVFNALIEYLPELITLLLEQVPVIIEQIVTTLLEMLPMLIEGIMMMVNGIIAAVPQIITLLCEQLPTIVSSILATLLSALPQLVQCGIQLFTSLIQALPEIINGILTAIPTIISSIIETILAALPLIIDCGIQLFVALVAELPNIIVTLISALSEIIGTLINVLVDSIPLFIQAGIDILCALVEALPEIIVALVAAIPTIISSLITAILGNIGLFIDAGVELFLAIIRNLPQIIVELVAAIPEVISSMVEAFLEGVGDFVEIGEAFINGLWEGIQGLAGWLWDQVSGWASDLWDDICGFFGIHSPSKLFKDGLGKNLMLGLALGIDDEASTVLDSMTDVAKDVANVEMEANSISFDEPDALYAKVRGVVDNQVSGKTAAVAAVSNRYSDEAYDAETGDENGGSPEYIENNIIIDGVKAARVLTPYVAKELAWEGR